MDPPATGDRIDRVLVLAGNIKEERPYGPGGEETRRGTRQLRAGAKVYLSQLKGSWAVLHSNDSLESIRVVGQHRLSRCWIECWVRVTDVHQRRLQVLCQPGALRRLREADWPGFWLRDEEYRLPEERDGPEAINGFLDAVGHRYESEWWRRDQRRRSMPEQLEVTMPHSSDLEERLEVIVKLLGQELSQSAQGYVSGSGTLAGVDQIMCQVADVSGTLPLIRRILLDMQAPLATRIIQQGTPRVSHSLSEQVTAGQVREELRDGG
jgi:hypothetical protein